MSVRTPLVKFRIKAELRHNGKTMPNLIINRTIEVVDRDAARSWVAHECIKNNSWCVSIQIDEVGPAQSVLYLPAPSVPPCTYKDSGGLKELWPVKVDRPAIKILKEDKT